MSDLVMAAAEWRTNAELIADVARLGYINGHVLDLTFGGGGWWKTYKPASLFTNDLSRETEAEYHYDFRHTPWCIGEFGTVAYDPPYVAEGGRKTSTIDLERYGQLDCPKDPKALQLLINQGLMEAARLTETGGHILCKVKNYISNGAHWPGQFKTLQYAEALEAIGLRLELVEQFVMVTGTGPQSQKNQIHARNNYSVLLVFRRRKP